MRIDISEFENSFKESLGEKEAKELIKRAILQVKLPLKKDYTKQEALKICDSLQIDKGFVGIIGGILASRIILRS
jgi:hypothetical protein